MHPLALLLTLSSLLASIQDAGGLRILVRDATGVPLPGITVALFAHDLPPARITHTETDDSGTAAFTVSAGSYLVSFEGSYHGAEFIAPAEQNAGVATAGEFGGFPIYADPAVPPQEWLFTFVVAQTVSGRLVPLWDTSRSPDASPEPYTYGGAIDEELHVPPEASALIAPGLPTPMVAESPSATIELPDATLTTATADISRADEDHGFPIIGLSLVLVSCGIFALVILRFLQGTSSPEVVDG